MKTNAIPSFPTTESFIHGESLSKWCLGSFKECSEKHYHYVIPCNEYDRQQGANFRITGDRLSHIDRSAPVILKKTVAYVGVDELDDGSFKWEKWHIKDLKFSEESVKRVQNILTLGAIQ